MIILCVTDARTVAVGRHVPSTPRATTLQCSQPSCSDAAGNKHVPTHPTLAGGMNQSSQANPESKLVVNYTLSKIHNTCTRGQAHHHHVAHMLTLCFPADLAQL